MARFDDKSRRTVMDFAGAMSVVPAESPDGSYSFGFERAGLVTLLASGEDRVGQEGPIMVSLARDFGTLDVRTMEAVFAAAGINPVDNLSTHAGLAGDRSLVLTCAIPRAIFDLPTLETAIDGLISAMDSVSAAPARPPR